MRLIPTEPALAQLDACKGQSASKIAKEQRDLFADKDVLKAAQDLFKTVSQGCPNTKPQMLEYIAFTLGQLPSPRPENPGDFEQKLLNHWESVFTFVGLSGADVPSPANGVTAKVLTRGGGAGIIDLGDGGEVLTFNGMAGIKVPAQSGQTGARLFTMEPTTVGCFLTNLKKEGSCVLYETFPHVESYAPAVTFGICQINGNPPHARLGHQHGNAFEVLDLVTYPAVCPPESHVSAGLVGRLLASVGRWLGPKPLIAAHGGLGGLGTAASPVGGVNTETFFADFSNDVVGQAPGSPGVGGGAWDVNAPPPGSVLVQAGLGDLTNKPVVLNQAGGACANCGVLRLVGTMFNAGEGAAADNGVYQVTFRALQNKPSVKEAPFVLRDSQGREIARLAYATVSSTRMLQYNGLDTGCRWIVGRSQGFTIQVDLDNKRTTLTVANCGGTEITSRTKNVGLANSAATDLSTLGWVWAGIDAGIVAWDDVQVLRLEDN
ncbi:MAG TPA: hypothetical protein VF178_07810 [Gemmatimonadaceae bacterium]